MTDPTATATADGSAPTGRILITGAHILSQDPAVGELVGDALLDAGTIAAVGADLPADQTAGATVIDGTGHALLPGFVDTHRHTWQGAIRQTGIGWNFGSYRRYIQNTWGPAFTPDDVYIGNRVGALDAINAGITTLRDESHISNSPAHTDQAIAALRETGIRAVFAFGWPSIDSDKWMLSGTQTHPEDIRRIRADVLADDTALVTLNAMLRGAELSSPEVTAADVAMSRELGIAMSMHVGNGPWGPQFRGIGTLADAGLLGPDMLFIHCCTSGDDELKAMVDAGAHASVAAAIEAVLPGLGAPATAKLIAAGARPSFSIDTEASVAGDMFNVMRAAIAAHGLGVTMQPEVYETLPEFTPRDLLSFATIDGAIAAGLGDRTGSITVGKAADVILVRIDDANMLPTNDVAASLVGAGHGGNVDTVIIDGVVRKHRGRLVGVDLEDLRARATASRDRLFAQPVAEA